MLLMMSVMLLSADDAAQFGRVVSIAGMVKAVSGEASRRLDKGDRVYHGETLKTDAQGQVQLLFADRSVVSLGPSAELVLAKLEPAERPKIGVKLVVGRVWARIQKFFGEGSAFTVETQNAVAGVRGTSIVVGSDGTKTDVAVERGEGVVTDKDGKEKILPPMTQLSVGSDGMSDVGTLDPALLGDLLNGFSTGGSFSVSGAGDRLSSAEQALTQGEDTTVAVTEPVATTPTEQEQSPVNIDPQQSNREATIRGTIEIVP